jgi:hypothetical protein
VNVDGISDEANCRPTLLPTTATNNLLSAGHSGLDAHVLLHLQVILSSSSISMQEHFDLFILFFLKKKRRLHKASMGHGQLCPALT